MVTSAAIKAVAGRMADADAAQIVGCAMSTVAHYRKRRCIPAHRTAWWQRALPLLGKHADQVVADMCGVSWISVIRLRHRHGIKAWQPRRGA